MERTLVETIDLLLDASGIFWEEGKKEYHTKLDTIVAEFTSLFPRILDDKLAVAGILLKYLHAKKPKPYNDEYRLHKVIDSFLDPEAQDGIGNCVGLSAFYAALGMKLGLHFQTIFVRDHVYLVTNIKDEGNLYIEPTFTDGLSAQPNHTAYRRLPLSALAAELYFNGLISFSTSGNTFLEIIASIGEKVHPRFSSVRKLKRAPDQFTEQLARIFLVSPNYPRAVYEEAKFMAARNDLPGAIRRMEEVREYEFEPGLTDYRIGSLLQRWGYQEMADSFLQRALAVSADNPWYNFVRAGILSRIGKQYDAVAGYAHALAHYGRQDDGTDQVQALSGIVKSPLPIALKFEIVQQQRAEKKASLLDCALAELYLATGAFNKAEALYRPLLERDDLHAEVYALVGQRFVEQKDFDTARSFYLRARAQNPKRHRYMELYADSLFDQRYYARCFKTYAEFYNKITPPTTVQKIGLRALRVEMHVREFLREVLE